MEKLLNKNYKEKFEIVSLNRIKDANLYPITFLDFKTATRVNAFHKSFPEYSITPLAKLNNFAKTYGVKNIYVKDESYRFNLNAFKVLGCSFAIGSLLAKKLGFDISELTYEKMISKEIREKLGKLTFVTATDGNHGRGVAWTANRLKQKSVVYMPRGTALERLENIKALGSNATITNLNYDEAVRLAKKSAMENDWVLVQDTSWEGYEEIPTWIMEGYTTMALETVTQLENNIPTHIFLQAGVGSMAAAMTGFFVNYYGLDKKPIITIVEPNKADCIFRTALANDGSLHTVTGDMDSIMAGLCCGEPCTIGWNVLKDYADHFVTIPDYAAAKGMEILGKPLTGDDRVISGESGAATFGLVAEILQNSDLAWLKEKLHINETSKILCFSTEGDTDKENYRRIVWDGLYKSY